MICESTTCEAEPSVSGTKAAPLEGVEAAKAFLVAESARLCAAAVRESACAIILTGSMSRGEATLRRNGMGWDVLGDVTLLMVFDRPTKLCSAKLEAEIECFLLDHGIRCKIVVVASTVSALKHMKPHIYAYELRERGVVVWGDQSALQVMRPFSAADLPIEDGWWLLSNRMIEQLESAARADNDQYFNTTVQYRITKLYLAMAACYLLLTGEYKPSYRERATRLLEVAASKDHSSSPIPLQRFALLVSACTHLKLNGTVPEDKSRFPEWCDAVSDAEAIWRWAVAQMSGSNPCLDRAELLARATKQQHALARAKGWLRTACLQRALLPRHAHRWARLGHVASPRYLIYGAASELFFASLERDAVTPQQLERIVEKLPLRPDQSERQLTWKTAAMLIAHNFHCLVESTRT